MPATDNVIATYAAYLARRLSASSIPQYLNVVRLLHVEAKVDNPCQSWTVKSTVRGIARLLGNPANRKTPVLPQLLLDMYKSLYLLDPLDAMFWAASLVLFFGTFRKSNLFPDNASPSERHFKRSDFVLLSNGCMMLKVKWSKTIQCQERSFEVLLPKIDHLLCPVQAVTHAFALVPLPCSSPAFVQDLAGTPLTGALFNKMFKCVLQKCGRDPRQFSSHSFRRGSATWALQCGVPGEVVKLMGDWKSTVYLKYLDNIPMSVLHHYRRLVTASLPVSSTPHC